MNLSYLLMAWENLNFHCFVGVLLILFEAISPLLWDWRTAVTKKQSTRASEWAAAEFQQDTGCRQKISVQQELFQGQKFLLSYSRLTPYMELDNWQSSFSLLPKGLYKIQQMFCSSTHWLERGIFCTVQLKSASGIYSMAPVTLLRPLIIDSILLPCHFHELWLVGAENGKEAQFLWGVAT